MNAAFPCGWIYVDKVGRILVHFYCPQIPSLPQEDGVRSAHPMQFQPACFNCGLLNENDITWEGDCRRGFWKAFQKPFLVNSWSLLLGSILVETFFEQTN
jgi:hypothetical protein